MAPALKPLFDRRTELAALHHEWEAARSGEARLVVLYGRRHVGKTFLVRHFLDSLGSRTRTVYMAATQESAEAAQLDRLRQALATAWPHENWIQPLGSWSDAFTRIAALADREPVAVVLDEVPYLEASTKGFGSVLQASWDDLRIMARPARLMLILTGSAVEAMRDLLGGQGPLFQRMNLELPMEPFDLPTAASFVSRQAPSRHLEMYAAAGGYPGHLERWDPEAEVQDNLRHLAFDPYGPLLQSGIRILADVPSHGGYRRVLAAVGKGCTRNSEIANEVQQRIEGPLEVLERAGFLRRVVPVGRPGWSKQPRYEITDPFFLFWFRMCYPDLQTIESGFGEGLLTARRDIWRQHVAHVFEEEARRHAARLVQAGELPKDLTIGRWWTAREPQTKMDVVGLRGGRTALVGEAEWTTQPLDSRMVGRLAAKARQCPDPLPQLLYAMWSRSGAEPELATGDVRVYVPDDMVR